MKAFVFDTETTGLLQNPLAPLETHSRIIELYGAVVDDSGNVLDEIEFLCNPGVEIDAKITKITGLTSDDLKDEPPFGMFVDDVDRILRSCDAVVAHNLTFDQRMIEAEFRRLGRDVVWPSLQYCTVEQTEYFAGRRLKLVELHEHLFGEKFKNAHRARHDVEALVRCWIELRSRELV